MKKTFFKKSTVLFIVASLGTTFIHKNAFAAGTMRDMTSMQIVYDMKIGWNLGNTLDAWKNGLSGLNTETCWGNPKTTKTMIDAVKAKGFKTIRLPVTWNGHFGAAPTYTIDKEWMDRVEEVAKYALDDNMYVILNSHHDEWVTLTASSQTEVTDKITKIWAQIADRFKDYSDYLIFETLNEPRLYGAPEEWNGGTDAARKILNAYNAAIVATIRNSGGNNALRHIMIPTHAATSIAVAQDALSIPNNDSRIIISQHTYWPYNFTMNTNTSEGATSQWGSASDKSACDVELDRIQTKFVKKGIPVVVGEWGSVNKSNTNVRAAHAEYYAKAVRLRGMLPVWWDNGVDTSTSGFGIFNRKNCTWSMPTIADGLIKGVQNGTPVVEHVEENPVFSSFEIASGNIKYSLPGSSTISLCIYTMQGRNVLNIVNGYQTAGNHSIKFPENHVSPGNYIFVLKVDNRSFTRNVYISASKTSGCYGK